MLKTHSVAFAIVLVLALPAMGQEGVYYTGKPSGSQVPPPLTEREISDPEFWRREKAAVLGRDANGMNLWDRGRYCDTRKSEVSQFAEIAMEWIFHHDLWTSPSKGFIPHGIAISDQQTLRMYAEVAFRDIRYVKGDGADISKCDEIAIFAIRRILKHMERYPADEE
ncbi:hypothetical protein H261_22468 [Paramagnetospirillum caucaseum]|uniref:Uncharacterized protein n=1 Tax=Paramagnetospirillum caucaseum TaxID=1244869 RepID=M2ZK25_9PROT|nr:hypothetical protein [Paramagnetospirillum caucaseum]EME67647.1 hypothetical protein H261_22468 [Paramagnetospirillum caucaseum]